MAGAVFNHGKMVHNSGTIVGAVSGGDMIIYDGQPRSQPRRQGDAATGEERPLVFINYRGSDEGWAATAIWQVWADRIGRQNVFIDNRSIPLGRPFDEELLNAVQGSIVLLAVIGSQWYGMQPDGRRLIDDENDWVRREICHALAHNVPVVPIFVEGMRLRAWELPAALRGLVLLRYFAIRREFAHSDLAGIVASVCELDERLAGMAGEQQ